MGVPLQGVMFFMVRQERAKNSCRPSSEFVLGPISLLRRPFHLAGGSFFSLCGPLRQAHAWPLQLLVAAASACIAKTETLSFYSIG